MFISYYTGFSLRIASVHFMKIRGNANEGSPSKLRLINFIDFNPPPLCVGLIFLKVDAIIIAILKGIRGKSCSVERAESRRLVRGGGRSGATAVPSELFRCPAQEMARRSPRYRRIERFPFIGRNQSGWYREVHLFVLECERCIYFWENTCGGFSYERKHQNCERSESAVSQVL